MFQDFLYALRGSNIGLTSDEFLNLIDNEIFNHQVYLYLQREEDYIELKYQEFMSRVMEVNDSKVQLLEDSLVEESWINHNYFRLSENCANMFMTFSLLYKKYLVLKEDERFIKVLINLDEDYWYKDFFEITDSIVDLKITDVLKLILNRFVIQKHDNAMYEKRDLSRCWFTRSGERYIFQADANLEWRSAKHDKICNFLFDMKLIDVKNNTFVVSKEGKELYKELKEKYYEE